MKKDRLVLISAVLLAMPNAKAQPHLTVGDDAPEMKFERWIKGDSISALQKGTVYVIDLWATWCSPCIAGWPHLTAIQKKYKDKNVYVLGISSVDSFGNTLQAARSLILRKDSLADFHFAWVPESVEK